MGAELLTASVGFYTRVSTEELTAAYRRVLFITEEHQYRHLAVVTSLRGYPIDSIHFSYRLPDLDSDSDRFYRCDAEVMFERIAIAMRDELGEGVNWELSGAVRLP